MVRKPKRAARIIVPIDLVLIILALTQKQGQKIEKGRKNQL
jgi:hypothetical protein